MTKLGEEMVDAPTPTSSQFPALYMVLVAGLVATILITVIGALVLSFFGKGVPSEVVAIAATAVGFLGGLLVPTPKA